MKLVIQIPCFNEAEVLASTLRDLPHVLPGIDQIEVLVIDDGSVDDTAAIARAHGVQYVHRLSRHVGLARAFAAGLDLALHAGADIIVNTDADNQYDAADIPVLIAPILEQRAGIVIGDRNVAQLAHFSPFKRFLQRLGSSVVARAAGLNVPDAASGFRAFSREAALRLVILSEFTYTLETLIQAGACGMGVVYVPVRVRPATRASRLAKSIPQYVAWQVATMIRAYGMYQPMRVFVAIGSLMILSGLIPGARFLYFWFAGTGTGHIQSLILASILLIVGFQVLLIGLLADLIGFNRKILEEVLYRLRKIELEDERRKQIGL